MLNLLIAENDIYNKEKLINDVLYYINDIRLVKITSNEEDTLDVLNNYKIDIVILNYKILNDGIDNFYNKLKTNLRKKYKESIIVIFSNKNIIKELKDNELIVDYYLENLNKKELIYKINQIVNRKNLGIKKEEIIKELKYIGYHIQYKGTLYLTESILYIYKEGMQTERNLEGNVYPIIASLYNKSVNNVKCNIRRATDCMYSDCEMKKLQKYFGLVDDEKPTAKEVIFTVLNKIQ